MSVPRWDFAHGVFLYSSDKIPSCFSPPLQLRLNIHDAAARTLTSILQKSQACSSLGKYLSALPANFSLFDLSFLSLPHPSSAVSNHYGCLLSGSALTVLSGSLRICHCEGDDESPLITPCHCTGSLRFVHQSCLQQWIKSSDTRCCELCKYEFIMETKLKPLRKVSDARRRSGPPLTTVIPPFPLNVPAGFREENRFSRFRWRTLAWR